MKLKNLYLLNTVLALVFALGLFLMTPIMLNLFGMNNTKDTITLSQFIAVELVVSGVTTFLARDVTDRAARSAINYSNLIGGVLGFIVALNATLSGVMGWFGYVLVVIYAVIAIGFAYFQFFGPMD